MKLPSICIWARHLDVLEDQVKAQFIIRIAGKGSNGVHIREVPLYIAGQHSRDIDKVGGGGGAQGKTLLSTVL